MRFLEGRNGVGLTPIPKSKSLDKGQGVPPITKVPQKQSSGGKGK
jgi:hypothetical protein